LPDSADNPGRSIPCKPREPGRPAAQPQVNGWSAAPGRCSGLVGGLFVVASALSTLLGGSTTRGFSWCWLPLAA